MALSAQGVKLPPITIRNGQAGFPGSSGDRPRRHHTFEDRCHHQATLRRSLRRCGRDLACSARCASPRRATSSQRQPMSDAGVWFQPVFTVRCYASAVFAVMQCPSVRPSVCLSRSWITSKRINISSKFFHHRVATPF